MKFFSPHEDWTNTKLIGIPIFCLGAATSLLVHLNYMVKLAFWYHELIWIRFGAITKFICMRNMNVNGKPASIVAPPPNWIIFHFLMQKKSCHISCKQPSPPNWVFYLSSSKGRDSMFFPWYKMSQNFTSLLHFAMIQYFYYFPLMYS